MSSLLLSLALASLPALSDLHAAPERDIAGPVLTVHNSERARVGAPPLQWDPELAAAATVYAQVLASGAPFQHSPRAGRSGQRENLSRGLPGASALQMVGYWTVEKRDFEPGVFPNVSRTGNWADVAHYTQMIWKTTTRVGCGVASGQTGEFMVCRYSPPGNADGRLVP
jgi:cysteine-rich secretory family protein